MRLAWAIAIGLILGAALAWWLSRTSGPAPASEAAASPAAPAPLYRWRDEAGVLHITEQPPPHGHYERIDRHASGSRITPVPGN